DADGNLLTASDDSGTYTRTYDALDRLATQTDLWNLTLTFGYDAASDRTSVQDSLGGLTTSQYDAAGRLTHRDVVTPLGSAAVDLTYTWRNQVETVTRTNADSMGMHPQPVATSSYTYDALGRITHLVHTGASNNVLDDFVYTYDLAGRLTSDTDNGQTQTYTYDATDQLLSDGTGEYSYDANGNRTMAGYDIGPDNQLLSDGTWNYTYDAEGNRIGKTKVDGSEKWAYTYDFNNHLLSAEQSVPIPGGGWQLVQRVTFRYDVFGNRIEKDVWTASSNQTTVQRYAYDDEYLWADLDGNTQLQTRYLRGDAVDQLFAQLGTPSGGLVQIGTAVQWLLPDRLGSVRMLTPDGNTIAAAFTYDSYGNLVS